jgi:hypothetical protein
MASPPVVKGLSAPQWRLLAWAAVLQLIGSPLVRIGSWNESRRVSTSRAVAALRRRGLLDHDQRLAVPVRFLVRAACLSDCAGASAYVPMLSRLAAWQEAWRRPLPLTG